MNDFVGQEVLVGDYVAFMMPGYRELKLGKVIKITPQKIRVDYTKWAGKIETTIVDSSQTVKLQPTDALAIILKG